MSAWDQSRQAAYRFKRAAFADSLRPKAHLAIVKKPRRAPHHNPGEDGSQGRRQGVDRSYPAGWNESARAISQASRKRGSLVPSISSPGRSDG